MRPTVDDDGDTVSNFDEQSSIPRDTDGDTTPDYLDDDSDGDGISDADEAGDTNVSTPPVDSDGDGTPDFQDLDSDNDSISDADEVTLGTDPTLFDTDGDVSPTARRSPRVRILSTRRPPWPAWAASPSTCPSAARRAPTL